MSARATGRYLAEHIPGARLLERDSAAHWPIPEPGLLVAIEEFITGSRVDQPEVDRVLTTFSSSTSWARPSM